MLSNIIVHLTSGEEFTLSARAYAAMKHEPNVEYILEAETGEVLHPKNDDDEKIFYSPLMNVFVVSRIPIIKGVVACEYEDIAGIFADEDDANDFAEKCAKEGFITYVFSEIVNGSVVL